MAIVPKKYMQSMQFPITGEMRGERMTKGYTDKKTGVTSEPVRLLILEQAITLAHLEIKIDDKFKVEKGKTITLSVILWSERQPSLTAIV
jgi:hypothetical protein